MRVCTPPTNLPPIKTAGTDWSVPIPAARWCKKPRMAGPSACSSSSTTVGATPRLMRNCLATVDMQQLLMLKITTALEEVRWNTVSQGGVLSLKEGGGDGCAASICVVDFNTCMIGGKERVVKDIWRNE